MDSENLTAAAPARPRVLIVGGGPAGLMAAERAAALGAEVDLYDRMGSVGRKLLIAGKGGLNLTHSEPLSRFRSRYAPREAEIDAWLQAFGPDALREWARGLGIDTVVGSSGRVFPADFKAAPLLRGWVRRLREQGVRFHVQHRWIGWEGADLLFEHGSERVRARADACVLALGGASWPVLGADPSWVGRLREQGLQVHDLQPANVGFAVAWSAPFRERHAGSPVKPVGLRVEFEGSPPLQRQGEFVVTDYGVEGSLIYALGAALRAPGLAAHPGRAVLDLFPGRPVEDIARALARPRGKRSLSEHLRRCLSLQGVRAGLLRECAPAPLPDEPLALAGLLKALPLRLGEPRPIEEAISSAGGLAFDELDARLMLHQRPGVFAAGEMIDWEAPTGGYLLTACFASGRIAGEAAAAYASASASASAGERT